MAKGDLFVAVQPGSIGLGEGDYLMVNVGDVAEAGHPVLGGREHMFEPMPIRFRIGDGQAETQPAEPVAKPKEADTAGRGAEEPGEPSEPVAQPEGKPGTSKAGSGQRAASVGLTSADAPGARRARS
jgi:hypothetical protein